MRPEDPQATLTPTAVASHRGEKAALAGILLLALGLRLWNLEANGWGAEYYSAAVRSMGESLSNFFFCAFDPAGFISVDKPPLALWLQVASVKLLGFEPLSLLLPQALVGTATVGVLFFMLRPRAGAMASLLAALFLALTPVLVAVNRANNTDSLLCLLLLLAAWALIKAAEEGRRATLLLALALVGLAFNTKMLAAFVVLPVMGLTYLLASPLSWPRRLLDLALAGVLALAVSLSWVLAVEFTPPTDRPFVGSTRGNSMLELVVGHNAWGRFFAREKPTRPATPNASAPPALGSSTPGAARVFVAEPTGPLRLVSGKLAAQGGWLLPLALLALVLAPWRQGWRGEGGRINLLILFWSGWAALYAAVFSYLGGIIHYYYLATLAPACAALAGLGVKALWQRYQEGGHRALMLPAALLGTALWQFHVQAGGLGWAWGDLFSLGPPWLGWLHTGLAGGALLAALGLAWALRPGAARLAVPALAIGLAACLALPTAWASSSVLLPGLGMAPSADLLRFLASPSQRLAAWQTRQAQAELTDGLISFLLRNQGGERYLLAATTTHLAAPIIIRTGLPVMARGGFHGLDPAMTPRGLERLAREGQVRFVMLGDESLVSRRMGAEAATQPVADWVRAHGRLVEPELWRRGRAGARMELYDLGGGGRVRKPTGELLDKPLGRREHVTQQRKDGEI